MTFLLLPFPQRFQFVGNESYLAPLGTAPLKFLLEVGQAFFNGRYYPLVSLWEKFCHSGPKDDLTRNSYKQRRGNLASLQSTQRSVFLVAQDPG